MADFPEEADLIVKVTKGDQQAFLRLYDQYAGRVYALTLRILRDPLLAEESTQDTFLKFWNRAGLYRAERGSFIIWLLTIARRTALDRLRLEKRRPVILESDGMEALWETLPEPDSLQKDARWRSLYFAVQSLPLEQKQVIELAFYQGLSQSEIAEDLGWPLGTVKTRVRAAMESLRREWLQNDPE